MALHNLIAGLFFAVPAQACDVALVLAVDISGSVDSAEYRLQMEGLAYALRDPSVSFAMVERQAAIALLQWTGTSRQRLTLPWTQLRSMEDVEAVAAQIAAMPRSWRSFSTAIGEALQQSEALFDEAPLCRRKVIDVSGDGVSNEGVDPASRHPSLWANGITVNGLVIETRDDADVTDYYEREVITGPGAFVMTAQGFEDFPDRMRKKLLRELVDQVSLVEP